MMFAWNNKPDAVYQSLTKMQSRKFVLHCHRYISPEHTHNRFTALLDFLSRITQVSRNQEGKINLDLLEQETVSGSGIIWAMQICTLTQTQPRQRPTTICPEVN